MNEIVLITAKEARHMAADMHAQGLPTLVSILEEIKKMATQGRTSVRIKIPTSMAYYPYNSQEMKALAELRAGETLEKFKKEVLEPLENLGFWVYDDHSEIQKRPTETYDRWIRGDMVVIW